jgi:hypothetical protein
MSRFDNDGEENFAGQYELWQPNVERALKGKRGQQALRDLEQALLDLPEKQLISGHLAKDGQVCTVGALVLHRRMTKGEERAAILADLDGGTEDDSYDNYERTIAEGKRVGLTFTLAWELGSRNDECYYFATPEQRYERILEWVRGRLVPEATTA